MAINGNEIDHPGTGFVAVSVMRRTYGSIAPSGAYRQGALSSGAAYIQADAGYSLFGQAAPADVRAGTSYAGGQLVGTLQTTSPTPQQIWEYAGTRSLTDKAGFAPTAATIAETVQQGLERANGPIDTVADTLAALQPRLQDAATVANVAQIVTDALSAT
jgi:hypothetical protein